MLTNLFFRSFTSPRDGEGDGTVDPNKASEGGDPSLVDPNKKSFTQEELNKILAIERKKTQDQTKKTIGELEALKQSKNLTEAEKKSLETKIEELNAQVTTKEELAKREKDKLTSQHQKEKDALTSERDTWRQRYTNETIDRSIIDAASAAGAISHEQIVALVKPITALKETEEGSGIYAPRVKMVDTDKSGKPVTLDLTVSEAVKRMKDTPEKYGNLFKDTAAGGLGISVSGKSKSQADIKNMTPEEYKKWRKENGFGSK